MFIPDPDLDFYLSQIPDPGVKKAPDPGSGSATLYKYVEINASLSLQVELFTLTGGGELKADFSLRAHTRVLTDLDWHTHNPDLLVTRWAASHTTTTFLNIVTSVVAVHPV
jgi:hypothetical protein